MRETVKRIVPWLTEALTAAHGLSVRVGALDY